MNLPEETLIKIADVLDEVTFQITIELLFSLQH